MGSVVQRGRAPMGRSRATVVEVKQGQGIWGENASIERRGQTWGSTPSVLWYIYMRYESLGVIGSHRP